MFGLIKSVLLLCLLLFQAQAHELYSFSVLEKNEVINDDLVIGKIKASILLEKLKNYFDQKTVGLIIPNEHVKDYLKALAQNMLSPTKKTQSPVSVYVDKPCTHLRDHDVSLCSYRAIVHRGERPLMVGRAYMTLMISVHEMLISLANEVDVYRDGGKHRQVRGHEEKKVLLFRATDLFTLLNETQAMLESKGCLSNEVLLSSVGHHFYDNINSWINMHLNTFYASTVQTLKSVKANHTKQDSEIHVMGANQFKLVENAAFVSKAFTKDYLSDLFQKDYPGSIIKKYPKEFIR